MAGKTETYFLGLIIEYDGTRYSGWQLQTNAGTIQGRLESALRSISERNLRAIGSGRTDAGVHASGQVVSVDLLARPISIDEKKIPTALNANLPRDIRVLHAKKFPYKFNARFDAIAREYRYSIILRESVFESHFSAYVKYNLDENILFESAKIFIGKHDFTTFSKFNKDTAHYNCDVQKCSWQKINSEKFVLTIKADRFVYAMVRSLSGAMIEAARGKISLSDLEEMLARKDRNLCPPLAAPNGLVLNKIYYPDKYCIEKN